MELSRELYWSLIDLLKALRGVKPNVAKETWLGVHSDAAMAGRNPDPKWCWDTCSTNAGGIYVTPAGAAKIVALYQAGELPMTTAKPAPVSTPVLAYIESGPAIEARRTELLQAEEAKRAAWEAKVAHPETIQESEFTEGLLNAVFLRRHGKGAGELEIGGIRVTKSVSRHASNSGKSQDWSVSFRWTGADGQPKELCRSSAHENNRRNDPERNWGLTE